MENLAEFDPLLVGTIPINIDIEGSDLDLICFWKNKDDFRKAVMQHFNKHPRFEMHESIAGGNDTIISSFTLDEFPVEVFGQNIPTKQQAAYRHMLIEHQLISEKGESFRQEIIRLKKQGYKTEPAFGKLLGLGDNPYEALLNYEKGKKE